MSVLLETSLGDLVIDLEVELCPELSSNFLKLCKAYYYNLNAFFNISKDFIAQVGDPTATGTGGESILSYIASSENSSSSSKVPRYFPPKIVPKLKHSNKGTVSMAVAPGSGGGCGSQFFITLADGPVEYLDGKHAVFGHVVEGMDVLDEMNAAFVDQEGRPLKDIRIRHVVVLDDPFPDPPGLVVPPSSPTLIPDANPNLRIADNEDALATLPPEDLEKQTRLQAASASALTLEMIGDLPFANVRPPENVLFVCKLNPVTRDEDLELIFSRFGKIMSCEVIRDKKTGDSLQYAFIEFDEREQAEQAYFKMQNVLVDDRRIWVDFSQSVSKMGGTWGSAAASAGRGGGGGGRGGGRGGRGGGRGGGGGGGGGFGGHSDLRSSKVPPVGGRDDGYAKGLVFDLPGSSGSSKGGEPPRRRERSRSPPRRERDSRNRDRDRDSDRDGGFSSAGHRDRNPLRRDRDRHDDRDDRDRNRDRYGGDRRRDDRDRDRDRDSRR